MRLPGPPVSIPVSPLNQQPDEGPDGEIMSSSLGLIPTTKAATAFAPRANLDAVLSNLKLIPLCAWSARFAYSDANRDVPCNDGDLVQSMLDIGSQNILLTQATSGQRPTYRANIFRGMPGIDFSNGIAMNMVATGVAGATTFATGYTVYVLAPTIVPFDTHGEIACSWSGTGTPYLMLNQGSGGGLQSKVGGNFFQFLHDYYDFPGCSAQAWDGVNLTAMVNGCFTTVAAAGTPPASCDFMVGNLSGNTTLGFRGCLSEILIFQGAHTPAQMAAISGAINTDYATRPAVIVEGDSQSIATGLIDPSYAFHVKAMQALGMTNWQQVSGRVNDVKDTQSPFMYMKCLGVGGRTVGGVTNSALSNIAANPSESIQYVNTPGRGTNLVNLCIVCLGENDINAQTFTPAAYLTNLQALYQSYTSLNCKVVVCTLPPRGTPAVAQYELDRATVNSALRNQPGLYCDVLADIAADLRIGTATNTTDARYYLQSDNIHWSEGGHAIVGAIIAKAIASILDVSGIFNPFLPITTPTPFMQNRRTIVQDVAYAIQLSDYLIAYKTLTAPRTATLPTALASGGLLPGPFIISDEAQTAATNNITVATTSGQTIGGQASYIITQNGGDVEFYSDGANWQIVGESAGATFSGLPKRLIPALVAESTLSAATINVTETVFTSTTYTIPANTLAIGDKIAVKFRGRRTASVAGPTLTLRFRYGGVGGTLLLTTGAVTTVTQTDGYLEGTAFLTVATIGATGTLLVGGEVQDNSVAGTVNFYPMGNGTGGGQNATVSVDTTANKDLVISANYSGNTAGNSISLSEFEVVKISA